MVSIACNIILKLLKDGRCNLTFKGDINTLLYLVKFISLIGVQIDYTSLLYGSIYYKYDGKDLYISQSMIKDYDEFIIVEE